MDSRPSVFGTEGRGFESLQPYQTPETNLRTPDNRQTCRRPVKDAGVDITTLDKHQLIAGGHDKDILAVFQGTTKLGGINEGALKKACDSGAVNRVKDLVGGGATNLNCEKPGASADTKNDIVVIKKIGLPGRPISYRTTLDPGISKAVMTR